MKRTDGRWVSRLMGGILFYKDLDLRQTIRNLRFRHLLILLEPRVELLYDCRVDRRTGLRQAFGGLPNHL